MMVKEGDYRSRSLYIYIMIRGRWSVFHVVDRRVVDRLEYT